MRFSGRQCQRQRHRYSRSSLTHPLTHIASVYADAIEWQSEKILWRHSMPFANRYGLWDHCRYIMGFRFATITMPYLSTYTFTHNYVMYTNVRISIQIAEGTLGTTDYTWRTKRYASNTLKMWISTGFWYINIKYKLLCAFDYVTSTDYGLDPMWMSLSFTCAQIHVTTFYYTAIDCASVCWAYIYFPVGVGAMPHTM